MRARRAACGERRARQQNGNIPTGGCYDDVISQDPAHVPADGRPADVACGRAVLWQSPVLAQETTGSVSGIVQDASGAVIPHAAVVLVNLQNKTERKTTSNGTGEFTIPSVPSDVAYQVRVSMQGFKTWESKPFPIRPGDRVGVHRHQAAGRRHAGRGDGGSDGEPGGEAAGHARAQRRDYVEGPGDAGDCGPRRDGADRDAAWVLGDQPGREQPVVSANTAAVGLNNGITGGLLGERRRTDRTGDDAGRRVADRHPDQLRDGADGERGHDRGARRCRPRPSAR